MNCKRVWGGCMGWTHSGPGSGRRGQAGASPVVELGVAAIVVVAVVPLLSWLAYLRFCRWLVSQSKDPSCLHDAAVAAKAFRASAPAVAEVVAKLAALMRRSGGP